MNIIAAVDKNWAIGKNNELLVRIPMDQKFFRETKIDYAYDADAYFPNLDEKPEWKITADSEEQTYFDLEFYFYKYERVQK